MRAVVIHNLPNFSVVSVGDGLSYVLKHKRLGTSVYFQGDDAARFNEELAAFETLNPNLPYDAIFAEFWDMYGELAE